MPRGRPKGSKDKHPNPEKRRAAIARNTGRPRTYLRDTDPAIEELRAAKGKLASALSNAGTAWLLQIIHEGPPHWQRDLATGERVLVEGSAQFEWAMNFAADRAGMPRRTEADLMGDVTRGFVIRLHDTEGGLGWPVLVAGGDGDGAVRPSVVQ